MFGCWWEEQRVKTCGKVAEGVLRVEKDKLVPWKFPMMIEVVHSQQLRKTSDLYFSLMNNFLKHQTSYWSSNKFPSADSRFKTLRAEHPKIVKDERTRMRDIENNDRSNFLAQLKELAAHSAGSFTKLTGKPCPPFRLIVSITNVIFGTDSTATPTRDKCQYVH